jgi:hypothetical protein
MLGQSGERSRLRSRRLVTNSSAAGCLGGLEVGEGCESSWELAMDIGRAIMHCRPATLSWDYLFVGNGGGFFSTLLFLGGRCVVFAFALCRDLPCLACSKNQTFIRLSFACLFFLLMKSLLSK